MSVRGRKMNPEDTLVNVCVVRDGKGSVWSTAIVEYLQRYARVWVFDLDQKEPIQFGQYVPPETQYAGILVFDMHRYTMELGHMIRKACTERKLAMCIVMSGFDPEFTKVLQCEHPMAHVVTCRFWSDAELAMDEFFFSRAMLMGPR